MVCYHCQQPGHMRRDCPQRQGSQGFGIVQSQSAVGQEMTQFVSPHPNMGQRDQYQSQGAAQAPSTSQTGHISQDQSVGRGRPKDLQVERLISAQKCYFEPCLLQVLSTFCVLISVIYPICTLRS